MMHSSKESPCFHGRSLGFLYRHIFFCTIMFVPFQTHISINYIEILCDMMQKNVHSWHLFVFRSLHSNIPEQCNQLSLEAKYEILHLPAAL